MGGKLATGGPRFLVRSVSSCLLLLCFFSLRRVRWPTIRGINVCGRGSGEETLVVQLLALVHRKARRDAWMWAVGGRNGSGREKVSWLAGINVDLSYDIDR